MRPREWQGDFELCMTCRGSGEGMYDGSTCPACKGMGEVPLLPEDYDPDDEPTGPDNIRDIDDDRADYIYTPPHLRGE